MTFKDAEQQLLVRIQKHSNINYNSLEGLEMRYSQFVSACEIDGYGDWLVEFDNDISVRNLIEEVIRSGELTTFEEFTLWQQNIHRIDTRLKKLFVKDKGLRGVSGGGRGYWKMGMGTINKISWNHTE